MTPRVPYVFHPPASQYETDHLIFETVEGGEEVRWPIVDEKLFYPGHWSSLKLEEIEANNKGKFRAYGLHGFSLGNYHEFLLYDSNESGFKMGEIEATFGEVSPLAAMIFYYYHHYKWHGDWDDIKSVRIHGVAADEVEAAFINVATLYEAKFGRLPELFTLTQHNLFEFDADEEEEPEITIVSSIVTNIEPLRYFYNGLSQLDDIAACIYFYKILEYFSFFTNAEYIKTIRHDEKLSDAEFPKRILEFLSRDEKKPVLKLISKLADNSVLNTAVSNKLIKVNTANALFQALYEFRNSIVHGKFSYGYVLHSGSILAEDPQSANWRSLLYKLARKALEQYGSRKT